MKSKVDSLVDKADAALLAAIEIFNKATFLYREETFAILSLNAWELLLKAKIIDEKDGDQRAIWVYETRQNRDGSQSKRTYVKRNRAGNPYTFGLPKAILELRDSFGILLPGRVNSNLISLTEVRDNSVHFYNPSPKLSKLVLEIGTASVRNYLELRSRWFGRSFDDYDLFVMPIGFLSEPKGTAIVISEFEGNLIDRLGQLVSEAEKGDGDQDFNVALEISISFIRRVEDAAEAVVITNDPKAPAVRLTEENIRESYPWTYKDLTYRLRKRYTDFKENGDYHRLRKALEENEKLSHVRLLDPGNPRSQKKRFFNSNVLREFDRHYTKA